jgi:hypothetical protein
VKRTGRSAWRPSAILVALLLLPGCNALNPLCGSGACANLLPQQLNEMENIPRKALSAVIRRRFKLPSDLPNHGEAIEV